MKRAPKCTVGKHLEELTENIGNDCRNKYVVNINRARPRTTGQKLDDGRLRVLPIVLARQSRKLCMSRYQVLMSLDCPNPIKARYQQVHIQLTRSQMVKLPRFGPCYENAQQA